MSTIVTINQDPTHQTVNVWSEEARRASAIARKGGKKPFLKEAIAIRDKKRRELESKSFVHSGYTQRQKIKRLQSKLDKNA